MAGGLTLDAGALIGIDKDDRHTWALLKKAHERGVTVTVPSVVLAQVWRGNSPRVARVLQGCVIEPLGGHGARAVGLLLAESRTADVVDGVVVRSALGRGDAIATSDPEDMGRLLAAYLRLYRTARAVKILKV